MPDREAAALTRYPHVPRASCAGVIRLLRRRNARKQVCRLKRRFSAERARGVNAVIEFRVDTGDAEFETFQLAIGDGRCRFVESPTVPTATIETQLEDLEALIDGRATTARLFMSQRLRVRGEVLLAVRLPDLFPAGH